MSATSGDAPDVALTCADMRTGLFLGELPSTGDLVEDEDQAAPWTTSCARFAERHDLLVLGVAREGVSAASLRQRVDALATAL